MCCHSRMHTSNHSRLAALGRLDALYRLSQVERNIPLIVCTTVTMEGLERLWGHTVGTQ